MYINDILLREAADTAGVSVETARKWLEKAIKLHEAHMAGKAPTTGPDGEKSQQRMMDQMVKALAALGGKGGSEMKMKEAASGELGAIMSLVRAAIITKLYPGETSRYVDIKTFFIDRAIVESEGRLVAFPYTLTDANLVELGEPVEVIAHFKPVAETAMTEAAGLTLREAEGEEQGLIWEATLIRSGLSGNGFFYSDATLREAVPLFDGRPVFAKADREHLAGDGKDVNKLIGWISDAKFVTGSKPDTGRIVGRVNLSKAAERLRTLIVDAWQRGKRDLVGLSIDAVGKAKPGKIGGQLARIAEAIKKVLSVDLIVEPGAGGALVRMVESLNPQEENDMKLRERMLKFIESKAPEAWKKIDAEKIDDEALEAAYREALAVEADVKAKATGAGGGQTIVPGVTREELAETTRMIEARATMRAKIGESGLPDLAKARLRRQFDGLEKFTEAQIDAAVTSEREYLSKLTESGKVRDLGDSLDIQPGEDRADKMTEMFDNFFARKEGVNSFRECYVQFTGDRNITGRLDQCDRARLRESAGAAFRESLDSTSWANALGNSITRAMIRDYRAAVEFDSWRQIVDVVPVRDFRTQERIRIGGYGDLPIVGQSQPYAALASPADQKATYVIEKRGGTEDTTLEQTANDDVGAVRRIPSKLGRAAKRTLAKFVFDFIRTNPVIFDAVALFDAAHGNLGSAVLDATSLAARRLAMLKQTELSSADRLGVGPSHLLVALDLQEAAVNLFNRNTNLDKTFINAMSLNIIPVWYWTDANDWALAANPLDVPCLEVGFFNGTEEPELFVQDNPTVGSMFSHDKLTFKIRFIFGGVAHDFKGLDKSVVA